MPPRSAQRNGIQSISPANPGKPCGCARWLIAPQKTTFAAWLTLCALRWWAYTRMRSAPPSACPRATPRRSEYPRRPRWRTWRRHRVNHGASAARRRVPRRPGRGTSSPRRPPRPYPWGRRAEHRQRPRWRRFGSRRGVFPGTFWPQVSAKPSGGVEQIAYHVTFTIWLASQGTEQGGNFRDAYREYGYRCFLHFIPSSG
jgi:hypothetical protein